MKRIVLALIVCPVVAAAQTPAGRWTIAGAGGLGYTSGRGEPLGFAWGLALRRDVSEHLALRLAADGANSSSRTFCSGPVPPPAGSQTFCTTELGASVFSFSLGVDWMAKRDRGLFGAGRVGIYSIGDVSGVRPGAYLGAGIAVPFPLATLVVEGGIHLYSGSTAQNWVAPALLGLRWRW